MTGRRSQAKSLVRGRLQTHTNAHIHTPSTHASQVQLQVPVQAVDSSRVQSKSRKYKRSGRVRTHTVPTPKYLRALPVHPLSEGTAGGRRAEPQTACSGTRNGCRARALGPHSHKYRLFSERRPRPGGLHSTLYRGTHLHPQIVSRRSSIATPRFGFAARPNLWPGSFDMTMVLGCACRYGVDCEVYQETIACTDIFRRPSSLMCGVWWYVG